MGEVAGLVRSHPSRAKAAAICSEVMATARLMCDWSVSVVGEREAERVGEGENFCFRGSIIMCMRSNVKVWMRQY